jgi:hypothetical protein
MKKLKLMALIGLTLLLCTGSVAAADIIAVENIIKKLTPQRGVGGADTLPNVTFHLNFELGSARILPNSMHHLENLCDAIKMSVLTEFILSVQGHTCDLGDEAYNIRLSRKRADAIRDYLINTCGLPPEQFQIKALGETQPLAPNISEKNRRRNRRVVVINTLQKFKSGEQGRSVEAAYLQMTYLRDNRVNVLKNGTVLTDEDGYAIEFRFKNKLYVYIGQIDSAGVLSLIFPNPEYLPAKNPVKANLSFRVPQYGNWFKLDNTAGDETVIVLASKDPLKNPEAVFRMKNESVRPSGSHEDIFIWKRGFVHNINDLHDQKGVEHPDEARVASLTAKGVELFENAQYDKAIEVFKKVLGMQDDHSVALEYLHKSYFEKAALLYNGRQFANALTLMEACFGCYSKCQLCREYKKSLKIEMLNRMASSFGSGFQKNMKKNFLEQQIKALEMLLITAPTDNDTQSRLSNAKKMLKGFISQ